MPRRIRVLLFAALFALLVGAAWGWAQSAAAQAALTSRLWITGVDAGSAPTIDLYVYGLDGQGLPLTFTPARVQIRHGGAAPANVEVPGQVESGPGPETFGTLTLFVVDTPPGVSDSLNTIQASIETYATTFYMREEMDYLGIYQVGEEGAITLLEPVPYHNSARNALAEQPLEILGGPTALVDSVMSLLTDVDTLKPHPGLATSLVIFSDGTDVVSSQFARQDVFNYAAGQGIPLHTVWLDNSNLGDPEEGRAYMRDVANNARGIPGALDQPDTLTAIWERIASFRPRTILRYTIAEPVGGEFAVQVSLTEDTTISAEASVFVPANAPSVAIALPIESRALTLPDLTEPVRLRLSATVSWLDGAQREVQRAQLLVNNLVAQEIPPDSLDDFTAEVAQFTFGGNTLQLVIEDDQGLRATSPPMTLIISEGIREVPEALEPGGSALSLLGRWALLCVSVVVLLGAAAFLVMRRGRSVAGLDLSGLRERLRLARRPRRGRGAPSAVAPGEAGPDGDDEEEELVAPYLELVESVSRLPPIIPIQNVETRIGRSPASADVVFENDITVSRIHASIVYSDGEFRIFDEQSTGGTWVNEQPVPGYGAPLVTGDEIRMGTVRLIFRWG